MTAPPPPVPGEQNPKNTFKKVLMGIANVRSAVFTCVDQPMPSIFKPTVVDPEEFLRYTRKIENLKPGTLLRLTRSSDMPVECTTGSGDSLFSRRFDKGECFMITEVTNSQIAFAVIDGAIVEVALVGIEMLSSAESFAYWAFAPGNFTEVKHFFSEFEILCPENLSS